MPVQPPPPTIWIEDERMRLSTLPAFLSHDAILKA